MLRIFGFYLKLLYVFSLNSIINILLSMLVKIPGGILTINTTHSIFRYVFYILVFVAWALYDSDEFFH